MISGFKSWCKAHPFTALLIAEAIIALALGYVATDCLLGACP